MRVYGTHSKEDCYAMCVNKKKNGVYANGATTDAKTGKICYCEFGMSKRNSVKKWKSTFIIRGMLIFYGMLVLLVIMHNMFLIQRSI